jgi:hypothetical protein
VTGSFPIISAPLYMPIMHLHGGVSDVDVAKRFAEQLNGVLVVKTHLNACAIAHVVLFGCTRAQRPRIGRVGEYRRCFQLR